MQALPKPLVAAVQKHGLCRTADPRNEGSPVSCEASDLLIYAGDFKLLNKSQAEIRDFNA
jgi:hypothetical protein